jgi:hypothetical protein
MIDWFTGDIGVDAKSLALDRILEVSRYGEKIYEIEKWLKVEGSFTDSIQLRRGNPAPSIADFFSGRREACPQQVAQLSGNPISGPFSSKSSKPCPVSSKPVSMSRCIRAGST